MTVEIDGANNIVKTNTISEVTSANGVTVDGLNIKDSKLVTANSVIQTNITDQAINEAKMQISNSPTNGYALTAQSGNTGGMTWASVGGANYVNLANAQSTTDVSEIAINGVFNHSLYKFYKLFLYILPSASNNTAQMQVRDSSNNNVTGNKYKSIAGGKTIYGSGQGDIAFDRWDGTYWMIAQNQKGAAPDGAFIDMTLRPYFSADSPSAGTWINWSVGYTRHTNELWSQANGTGNEDSTTNLSGGGMRFYYGGCDVSEYQYNLYGVKYA